MTDTREVAAHYARDSLLAAIERGIVAMGRNPAELTVDDLAPVDEFHIGGREATDALIGQLAPAADQHLLDVGCGLGGASRYVAARFGTRVSGLDLTVDYVETGQALSRWLGLDDRVALHHGSALAMPFADASFDAAYMLHVGMNIADKAALCAEVARVLRPGGRFAIYDVMRTGDDDLVYPVPWAMTAATSAVAPVAEYRAVLAAAGFELEAERDRRAFALDFFQRVRARAAKMDGPPPLGLHLVMGERAGERVANMAANVEAGRIAPVELIARRMG